MKKQNVTVELSDGTVVGPVRVTLQDRLRMERAAKPNGWNIGESSSAITVMTFLAWAALERTGAYPGSFEQFAGGDAVDIDMDQDDEPATAAEAIGDPTQPAPGIA